MMPIGVEFGFKFPLEIFVELRPGIVVLHSPGVFDFGGQLGFRYGFGRPLSVHRARVDISVGVQHGRQCPKVRRSGAGRS